MPAQSLPTISVGRTGTLVLNSEYGHAAGLVATQADGAIVFLTNTTVQRRLPDGTPDLSFNSVGSLPLPRGLDPQMGYPDYYGPTLLEDGKILVSAADSAGSNSSLMLLRLHADGRIDTSFGTLGRAVSQAETNTTVKVTATKVLADGKILVVSENWGREKDGSSGSSNPTHIGLSRYLENGAIDTSFGVKGFALDDENVVASHALVQADGKIVVSGTDRIFGGYKVVRFNADGSRDKSFGGDGTVVVPTGSGRANASAIQPDGKLLVVGGGGYNGGGVIVVRLNTDGSVDKSFADDGTLFLNTLGGEARFVDITDDGSIVIGASIKLGQSSTLAVLRLSSNGVLDATYGEDGIALVPLPVDKQEYWAGMEVRPDGRVLLTGELMGLNGGSPTPMLTVLDAHGRPDAGFGPALHISNSASYTQGYLEQFLNPDLQVDTLASYEGMSVTLARKGGANAADHFTAGNGLSFVNGALLVKGVDIGTVAERGGSLQLQFNAAATRDLINIALQGIGYENTGTYTSGQHVTINWQFGVNGAGTGVSTDVTLHRTDAPYWIDQLLHRLDPDQTAAALRTELLSLLEQSRVLDLQFAADGTATPFSTAERDAIRKVLGQLTGVIDLKLGTAGTELVVHRSAEVAAGASATSGIVQGHGDVFLSSSSPTAAALLHALELMLGLQRAALPAADAAANAAQDLGLLDIAALQFIYGPSKTERVVDDTYQLSAGEANFIWDGAGKDTISAAGLSGDVVLHLEPGYWDYVGAKGGAITAAGQVTVNYGTSIENAVGGSGNDRLTGTAAVNALSGGDGNDVLTGMGGNDVLAGGTGIDTAVYGGKAATYVVSRTASGWSVSDARGLEGLDQLTGMEHLQFADKVLAIGDDAAQVFRLYQAAFGRTPDLAGLGYWLHVQESGRSVHEIAAGIQGSPEYQKLYGVDGSNAAFITQLYQNVLHRAPDAAGLAYWDGHLQTDISRLDALLGFSESKENIAALVGKTDRGMEFIPFL